MPVESKPIWMQHGGWYRPILDLSTPWVGSPVLDKPKTPAYLYVQPTRPPKKKSSNQDAKTFDLSANNGSRPLSFKRLAIYKIVRRLVNRTGKTGKLCEVTNEAEHDSDDSDEVPLRDWKAWGYYAYPKLHGHYLRNFPPSENLPPSVNVEEVFRSLSENKKVHPDRWIPGLQHPALPPRPVRWKPHRKGDPLPFPWACQLNPFLQHVSFGRPHLDWDISSPSSECYMGRTNVLIPLSEADRAQPATYPFVTHMYINSLAEDPYPEHFWPFYVVNEHGITVKDVLDKVYENFQQYLSLVEFQSWEDHYYRQNAARVAFEVRWGHTRGQQARRVDILGTHCMFRGLEPHPNREGWTMFVGLA